MEPLDINSAEYLVANFLSTKDAISLVKTCHKLHLNLDKTIIRRGLDDCINNNIVTKLSLFKDELNESALWSAINKRNGDCLKEILRLRPNLGLQGLIRQILSHDSDISSRAETMAFVGRFCVNNHDRNEPPALHAMTLQCLCSQCEDLYWRTMVAISEEGVKHALRLDFNKKTGELIFVLGLRIFKISAMKFYPTFFLLLCIVIYYLNYSIPGLVTLKIFYHMIRYFILYLFS